MYKMTPLEPRLISAGPRPASVYFRGGEVHILVHDRYHISMRRRMLQDLKDLHPDAGQVRRRKGGCRPNLGVVFRHANSHYHQWLKEEFYWYSVFHLKPPLIRSIQMTVERKPYLFTKVVGEGYTRHRYLTPFTTAKVRAKGRVG